MTMRGVALPQDARPSGRRKETAHFSAKKRERIFFWRLGLGSLSLARRFPTFLVGGESFFFFFPTEKDNKPDAVVVVPLAPALEDPAARRLLSAAEEGILSPGAEAPEATAAAGQGLQGRCV